MSESERKQIRIRKAAWPDMPGVLAIERECFPTPWIEAMYGVELSREAAVFLAADDDDGLAGYLCAWAVEEEGHILKIAVRPEKARRGIGRALMDALAAEFMRRGVREMWLEVRAGNTAARSFYADLGFSEQGGRRRYYSDTGEDAVIMLKRLD